MKRVTSVLVAFATVFLLFAPTSFAGQRIGDQVVDIAFDYSGSPYVYGGESPSGFDCSGFTQYVFGKVGIDLNRSSSGQWSNGHRVSRSELQKGDLLFFNYYDGGAIGHVGIYIGNNKMISAENPRDDITVASVAPDRYWGERMVGARRVIEEVAAESTDPEPLPTGEYHDVASSHWAADEIEYMSKQGIINGYDGDYFKPDNKVSRGEVAKMLSVSLDLGTSTSDQFSDTDGHWSEKYINAAAKAGYINGYEDGTYKPEQDITRQEIAALFDKAFGLSGSGSDFDDVSSEHWAYDSIQALAASGITTGYEDGTFKPWAETKRSEFAVFLYRALY
ncbi:C40 family peptidase [Halobacillus mangrovi]|uniref:Hydrolase Nlp/P60 n=1 Tax=Halobacillus mangrovi TaxID=402384 RepID=A0A1W6A0H2_9BACI|nr:C40 family peptidase [Halobacillus mangrovi]ARI79116.1 hypothetical protein HM131_05035 [Halobacillus mangrovi]